MGPESLLILLFVFKHLVFDWWMQPPWMAFSKHDLREPGGYIHAFLNVLGTMMAIATFILLAPSIGLSYTIVSGGIVAWFLVGEFVSHYIMDFTKMNVNRKMNWKCDKHSEFWWLIGFDQWFHMTYLVIMASVLV